MAIKVMLVNGGPHKNGTTNRALDEIEKALTEDGIEVGRFWVGAKPIAGCIGCQYCATHEGECTFHDVVNEFNHIAADYDGFIFGTPVHYAAASGATTSFMDRSFYSQALGGVNIYPFKPAASVVVARRGGCSSTFDQLNKYYTIVQMPIISSSYWNMVYGNSAEDAEQDAEGLRTMRVLGHNMAYHLKCQKAGEAAGILPPAPEPAARTNFIR
ncbi:MULTISPECIES: flavodoxin family protein [unclassified Adlercreutzia]|uniref:flavodoxin family protein n=1 Tax=unclassified Adlercreutzia TaxID=2636013 RepID=UPI001F153FD6|nr:MULTISPECIES: flavodoxin family protein [unclassified Adlercreutzia]